MPRDVFEYKLLEPSNPLFVSGKQLIGAVENTEVSCYFFLLNICVIFVPFNLWVFKVLCRDAEATEGAIAVAEFFLQPTKVVHIQYEAF